MLPLQPQEDSIKTRLRKVAYDRMDEARFGRTERFEYEFDRLLTNAAARMRTEGVGDDEPRLRAAEAVTLLFVDSVIAAGRDMGFAEAHEPTFFAALRLRCPIWPFC